MVLIKSKKGFLFTIATIILILPLIYLVSFYSSVSETQMDDTIARIRCDELHYYVEDVKKDMGRAATVFGTRAALYTIDKMRNGTDLITLKDYEFSCTPGCGVDCDEFTYPENGSEAAIAEMIVCGTLFDEDSMYMENNTLPDWVEKIEDEGETMGFFVNITPTEIKVVPMDAWHFAVIIENKVRVSDREGMCFYEEKTMTAMSNASIITMLDPFYIMRTPTREAKQIKKCRYLELPRTKAGCGVNGSGIGGGNVVFYDDPDIDPWIIYKKYCNGSSSTEPTTGDVRNQVLVVNEDSALLCNSGIEDCLNVSMPRHFGGVIFYNDLDYLKCNATIPWISGTGDLGEGSPPGYGDPVNPDCNDSKISDEECVLLQNIQTCDDLSYMYNSLHFVLLGCDSADLDASCYYVSDIGENYNSNCALGESYPNGPCFFDRLDGNLNLSKRYVNQSNEIFGTTMIGIESLVNMSQMSGWAKDYENFTVNLTYSWVDYLYWMNVTGSEASGYCGTDNYSLMLDCPHAYKYRVDTENKDVNECPTCVNGICESLETCVICPDDCECPGCPVFSTLTFCAQCSLGNCDVTFTLVIRNQSGHLMDLSEMPTVNVTIMSVPPVVVTTSSNELMSQIPGDTGRYNYTEVGVGFNEWIGGSVRIREPGCPLDRNATDFMRAMTIPDPC
jgi:hypothetical protein